jgi:hypothetical protein
VVIAYCLELQEAPITKQFEFSLNRLELRIAGVYLRFFRFAGAAANNPAKTSFSRLSTHQLVPTTLGRQELYSGADPVAGLAPDAIRRDRLSFYDVANFGPLRRRGDREQEVVELNSKMPAGCMKFIGNRQHALSHMIGKGDPH